MGVENANAKKCNSKNLSNDLIRQTQCMAEMQTSHKILQQAQQQMKDGICQLLGSECTKLGAHKYHQWCLWSINRSLKLEAIGKITNRLRQIINKDRTQNGCQSKNPTEENVKKEVCRKLQSPITSSTT